MKKTLIIISVLLMFITLTSPLFCLEISADVTITDLTGTKWQLKSTLTGYLSMDEDYSLEGIATSDSYTIYFEWLFEGDVTISFEDELHDNISLFYSRYYNKWYYKTSSGENEVTAPQIEINGGADATNIDVIEWLQDNATQIIEGYNVSFNSYGGSSIATVTGVTSLSLWDYTNNKYKEEFTPTKDGFIFDGWYSDSSLTNEVREIFILDSDKTLYAKWIPTGHNVYFYSMGGSSVPTIENTTAIFLTDANGNYLPEYIPTRAGYKFDGWYDDENYTNKITIQFIITHDITLYAKWTPIYIYFHMNGGSGVGYYGETDIGEYQYDGGTLDLIDSEGNYKLQFTPFKEGWIFGGWYTDPELTIPILYVNTEDDINLYAKWTKELLVELNLKSKPQYRILLASIDSNSGTYISGSENVVRYIIGDTEESSYIDFYAISAGAAEIRFNDYDGNEYTFVIYVLEYGTTINYFKTIYIGSRYEITDGLSNVDLSSMTYIGGDNTYCYVSSPYAGIPLNGDETPEGDYIYFYGLKKGYCIINFNGKNGYPPVTFYLTILGVGEISLEQSMPEMPDIYIPPIETWRGWENLQKQLEDGYHNNFINLDAFQIPGELNGFITNFNVWVNPLYTNGFVVLALTLVGIIAFASYLVTAKTRG